MITTIVVILRDGVWVLLTWLLLFNVLPVVLAQTSNGLYWNLDIEEDFLMYEIVFRDAEDNELSVSVNMTFGSNPPDIPETLTEWNQIPEYSVSMVLSNGTEIDDLSTILPFYTYTVLPVGNWEFLSNLVKAEYNDSATFEVSDESDDYWGYTNSWDDNASNHRYAYSFDYYKDSGLLISASFWAHDRIQGGHSEWSVHFHRDYTFNSPLPAIYTTYTLITLGSFVALLLWVRRTNRF